MTNYRPTTVNRKHADSIVAIVLTVVLMLGGIATWQAYRQWTTSQHGHMGMDTAVAHGVHPAWYFLATIVAVGVISGIYLGIRDRVDSPPVNSTAMASSMDETAQTQQVDGGMDEQQAVVKDTSERRILDVLPDDERRILEPIIESPGLTQIALRDRSGFSKSKVSQTVTTLEKRGLLYREPQGQTYRIYPGEELTDEQ